MFEVHIRNTKVAEHEEISKAFRDFIEKTRIAVVSQRMSQDELKKTCFLTSDGEDRKLKMMFEKVVAFGHKSGLLDLDNNFTESPIALSEAYVGFAFLLADHANRDEVGTFQVTRVCDGLGGDTRPAKGPICKGVF
jgi:hypothetical protein